MNARVIPLIDERHTVPAGLALPAPLVNLSDGPLRDRLQRPLTDLRISVTDRCNFRCAYCMPKEVFGPDYRYQPRSAMLSFEEITRLARLFAAQGVRKIRLTGGEPLLRRGIETLIAQLAALRTPDGTPNGSPDGTPQGEPLDLTLTTNGSLLARKAQALRAAGLKRVTVSLDGLDDAVFRRMNDVDFPVAEVLAGIEAAQAAGLGPIKVNMVVQRGVNESEILPMARRFRGTGVALRFIEYMDVGATNGWRMDQVLPSAEVVARIAAQFPLQALPASAPGETAQRFAYADGAGEIGVISSVTQAFCHDCSRARLSTEGRLYLCLFASQGHDLQTLLRQGASDAEIAAAIAGIWQGRSDRYSELRALGIPGDARRVEMSYIGG
jgi:cyclic pyranopterin phosphate synthase